MVGGVDIVSQDKPAEVGEIIKLEADLDLLP